MLKYDKSWYSQQICVKLKKEKRRKIRRNNVKYKVHSHDTYAGADEFHDKLALHVTQIGMVETTF